MTSVAVPSLSPVRVRVRAGRFLHVDYYGWPDIEVPCPVCVAQGGPCVACAEGAEPGYAGAHLRLHWWEVAVVRTPFPESLRHNLDVGLGDAFFHYFNAINPVRC